MRISGRLIDYQTGLSATGATTLSWRALIPGTQTSSMTVTTDANGRFDITVPTDQTLGEFFFQYQTGPINFQSGTVRAPSKHLDTDLLVNSGPCAARYGYVFDATTRLPLAGARVQRAGTATTDANGYYRIDIGCEPRGYEYWGIGTTTISASHPSYQGVALIDGRRESTSYSGIRRVDFALQPLP